MPSRDPAHVVVAEDDSLLREILVETLMRAGYLTSPAEDGQKALEIVRDSKVDILLLDMHMPRKDGIEVLEEVRKDARLRHLPVIVLSNSGEPVEVAKAKKLGVTTFLIKTILEPKEVLDHVQTLLYTRR